MSCGEQEPGCARRTAEGGCPHINLLLCTETAKSANLDSPVMEVGILRLRMIVFQTIIARSG